jgi:hypothetical protein|tara:strand:- start:42 stop:356 length:315 start_codon:yes stop_codon:yes gene_type:complete
VAETKLKSVEEQLLEAKTEIIELKISSKTTITGAQFLAIVLVGPLFLSFCVLGVLIVWKTLSNPAQIAPHLELILISFAIFATPVTSAAGIVISQIQQKKSKEE